MMTQSDDFTETMQGAGATAGVVRRGVTALSRRFRAARLNHGVSPSKLTVLSRLRRAGPLTSSRLAALERIQPQSLTRLIGDLEDRGLVRRRPDLQDRRQILIEITPEAVELLRNDARAQDTWLTECMMRVLTPTEAEILKMAAALMEKLAENAIEE